MATKKKQPTIRDVLNSKEFKESSVEKQDKWLESAGLTRESALAISGVQDFTKPTLMQKVGRELKLGALTAIKGVAATGLMDNLNGAEVSAMDPYYAKIVDWTNEEIAKNPSLVTEDDNIFVRSLSGAASSTPTSGMLGAIGYGGGVLMAAPSVPTKIVGGALAAGSAGLMYSTTKMNQYLDWVSKREQKLGRKLTDEEKQKFVEGATKVGLSEVGTEMAPTALDVALTVATGGKGKVATKAATSAFKYLSELFNPSIRNVAKVAAKHVATEAVAGTTGEVANLYIQNKVGENLGFENRFYKDLDVTIGSSLLMESAGGVVHQTGANVVKARSLAADKELLFNGIDTSKLTPEEALDLAKQRTSIAMYYAKDIEQNLGKEEAVAFLNNINKSTQQALNQEIDSTGKLPFNESIFTDTPVFKESDLNKNTDIKTPIDTTENKVVAPAIQPDNTTATSPVNNIIDLDTILNGLESKKTEPVPVEPVHQNISDNEDVNTIVTSNLMAMNQQMQQQQQQEGIQEPVTHVRPFDATKDNIVVTDDKVGSLVENAHAQTSNEPIVTGPAEGSGVSTINKVEEKLLPAEQKVETEKYNTLEKQSFDRGFDKRGINKETGTDVDKNGFNWMGEKQEPIVTTKEVGVQQEEQKGGLFKEILSNEESYNALLDDVNASLSQAAKEHGIDKGTLFEGLLGKERPELSSVSARKLISERKSRGLTLQEYTDLVKYLDLKDEIDTNPTAAERARKSTYEKEVLPQKQIKINNETEEDVVSKIYSQDMEEYNASLENKYEEGLLSTKAPKKTEVGYAKEETSKTEPTKKYVGGLTEKDIAPLFAKAIEQGKDTAHLEKLLDSSILDDKLTADEKQTRESLVNYIKQKNASYVKKETKNVGKGEVVVTNESEQTYTYEANVLNSLKLVYDRIFKIAQNKKLSVEDRKKTLSKLKKDIERENTASIASAKKQLDSNIQFNDMGMSDAQANVIKNSILADIKEAILKGSHGPSILEYIMNQEGVTSLAALRSYPLSLEKILNPNTYSMTEGSNIVASAYVELQNLSEAITSLQDKGSFNIKNYPNIEKKVNKLLSVFKEDVNATNYINKLMGIDETNIIGKTSDYILKEFTNHIDKIGVKEKLNKVFYDNYHNVVKDQVNDDYRNVSIVYDLVLDSMFKTSHNKFFKVDAESIVQRRGNTLAGKTKEAQLSSVKRILEKSHFILDDIVDVNLFSKDWEGQLRVTVFTDNGEITKTFDTFKEVNNFIKGKDVGTYEISSTSEYTTSEVIDMMRDVASVSYNSDYSVDIPNQFPTREGKQGITLIPKITNQDTFLIENYKRKKTNGVLVEEKSFYLTRDAFAEKLRTDAEFKESVLSGDTKVTRTNDELYSNTIFYNDMDRIISYLKNSKQSDGYINNFIYEYQSFKELNNKITTSQNLDEAFWKAWKDSKKSLLSEAKNIRVQIFREMTANPMFSRSTNFFEDEQAKYSAFGFTKEQLHSLAMESGYTINTYASKVNQLISNTLQQIVDGTVSEKEYPQFNKLYNIFNRLSAEFKNKRDISKLTNEYKNAYVESVIFSSNVFTEEQQKLFKSSRDGITDLENISGADYNKVKPFIDLANQIDLMFTTENLKDFKQVNPTVKETVNKAKVELNQDLTVEDVFTAKQETEHNNTERFVLDNLISRGSNGNSVSIGTLVDKDAHNFFSKMADALGAELVVVKDISDNAPQGKFITREGGNPIIVVNTAAKYSFGRVFAHELFHSIVKNSTSYEYTAFKNALSDIVDSKTWYDAIERARSIWAPQANPSGVYDHFQGKAKLNMDKATLSMLEEEVHSELFSLMFNQQDFWNKMNTTPHGKRLGQKLIDRLVTLVKKVLNVFFDSNIASSKNGIFNLKGMLAPTLTTEEFIKDGNSFSRKVLDENMLDSVYRLMGHAIEQASIKNNVEVNSEKLLTYGETKSYFNDTFKSNQSLKLRVMNGIEKIIKDIGTKFNQVRPGGIFTHIGATEETRTLMNNIAYAENLVRAQLYSKIKQYEKLFSNMTKQEHENLHDLLFRSDLKSDADVLKRLESMATAGKIDPKVVEFFKVAQKMSDAMYGQLLKYYPDLPKLDTHFGQSIRWFKDNTLLDDSFDWLITGKSSRLMTRDYFTKERSNLTLGEVIAQSNLSYETADPFKLLMNYIGDSSRLIQLNRSLETALKTKVNEKDTIARLFTSDREALKNGYVTLDDRAFQVLQNTNIKGGYKVFVDGEVYKVNDQEQLFVTKDAAERFAENLRNIKTIQQAGSEVTIEEATNPKVRKEAYFAVVDKDGNTLFTAKTEAEALEQAGDKFTVKPVYAKDSEEVVARIYFKKDMARMLNTIMSKDKIREGHILGISGKSVMNIKNEYTSWELGLSLFHMFTIGEEMSSSFASYSYGRNGLMSKGTIPLLNIRRALKQNTIINDMVTKVLEGNYDPTDLATREKLTQVFGTADADVVDIVRQYFNAGGLRSQDTSLRSSLYNEGHFSYTDENGKVSLDAMKNSVVDFYNKEVKEFEETNPNSKLKFAPLAKTARFTAMKGATSWLMETAIPQIKMAQFAREYTLALEKNAGKLELGATTKEEIARNTMAFIEDRFGEVNWTNMWLDKSYKSSLQLAFRSFTWIAGNIKAISKSLSDYVKLGWFTLKGEKYELTEKGHWGISVIATHLMTSAMVNIAFNGVSAMFGGSGEDPTDKNIPFLLRILFPRTDPFDASKRIAIPSYVTEFAKIANHLGVGGELEPIKIISGRFNGMIGKAIELIKNKDYKGTYIIDPNDSLFGKAMDMVTHLLPTPISASTIKKNIKQEGFSLSNVVTGFLGFTDAPAYAKRSVAENLAYAIRRREYLGKDITQAEAEHKDDIAFAMHMYSQGDRTLLDKMFKEGTISKNEYKKALAKVPRIDGKVNPAFKSGLERAVKGLTLDGAMEVWESATDDEKKRLKPLIFKKYTNMIGRKDRPQEYKIKAKDNMKKIGILQ